VTRITTVGIAALVIIALGLASSTLATSQSTDAADAVNIETDRLPVGEDRQADIRTVVQSIHDQYTDGQTNTSPRASGAQGSSAGQVDDSASSGGASASPQRVGEQGTDWLSVLLGLGAVGMTGVVGYYRRRIWRVVASRRTDTDSSDPTAAVEIDPETEIERAWVELLTHAGVQQPWRQTPQECARIAIETGYDSTAVNRLRRAFEDTRYGGSDPTGEQQRLAQQTLAQFTGESE
jgi:hypothetical protein